MLKYSIVLLLFTFIISSEVTTTKDNSIEDFLKCIKSTEPLIKDINNIISSIKDKNYDALIDNIYISIENGNTALLDCLSLFPDLAKYLQSLLSFEWNDLVKCILDTKPVAGDILDLIEIIKSKNYEKAISIIYQLYLDGRLVVKECIEVFKKKKEVILGVNWAGLKTCLSSILSAACISDAQAVINYINAKNYTSAIKRANVMLTKGCLGNCIKHL